MNDLEARPPDRATQPIQIGQLILARAAKSGEVLRRGRTLPEALAEENDGGQVPQHLERGREPAVHVRRGHVDDRVKRSFHGRRVADLEPHRDLRGLAAGLGDGVGVEVDAETVCSGVSQEYPQQHLTRATAGVDDERIGR